ncbi:MAG: gliding motility-associated C-terminal domain-containing protein [Paludibacteraceae bacterium]|nr:gliding motility-associated C-terminal domain-containing protein [Paludibacteraceae bacterium]
MKITNGELRVATPNANGYSWICTKSDVLKNGGTWMGHFYIGTTPTVSNYTIFVLSSENDDMNAPKGYFVKVGGAAKNICLFSNGGESLKGDNTTLKTLIKSEDKRVNSTSVKVFIKVTRDSVGNWKLESKKTGESDFKTEGTAFDSTYTTSNYAGIGLGYTQSKYNAVGADNIRIFEKDTIQDEPDEIPVNQDSITTEDAYEAESTLKINEVMADATKDETEEYIELINTTEREISLWQTWIAVRKKDGSLGTKYYFPYKMQHDFDRPKVRYVEPKGVVCVSEAPELDSTYYMSKSGSHFVKMDLPSLNNEGACIVIGSDDKTVHDEFCYSKSMYGDMIKNRKNVALERVSTKKPSLDPDNWKVASGINNYGTPGYKNSNAESDAPEAVKKGFWLENDHLSPNNDGLTDVLLVNYNTGHDDYSANITVYNMKGKPVRTLYNNIMLSSEGTIEWDGTDDSGKTVDSGMYVMMVEMLSARGKKIRSYKLAFAVTGV